jgi:predicted ATPase
MEEEAIGCFHRAIEVAKAQKAKSWELRATMSLCRLLQKQGKQDQARIQLSEICNWFTEGFDTPDLIEAKELLDALSLP